MWNKLRLTIMSCPSHVSVVSGSCLFPSQVDKRTDSVKRGSFIESVLLLTRESKPVVLSPMMHWHEIWSSILELYGPELLNWHLIKSFFFVPKTYLFPTNIYLCKIIKATQLITEFFFLLKINFSKNILPKKSYEPSGQVFMKTT